MLKKIAVVSLWADDVPKVTHFYHDVLGLRLLDQHNDRPHFYLDGVYLTILKGRPTPAQDTVPARFPLFAFAVDDINEVVERLRAYHVEMPWGIEQDSESRWVMFYDPGENLIELVQLG